MKPDIQRALFRPALIGLSALLAGCGLSQPYPAKQLYAIDVGVPENAPTPAPGTVLRVAPVRVAAPFSNRDFQYRTGQNRFERDYYSNFIADPSELVTALLVEWMSETGLYEAVVDASSTLGADHSLRCVVSQLYGDYSDASAPRAVVAVRFFLIDESDVEGRVLFTEEYRESSPAADGTPDALVAAWNANVRAILSRLTADLRALPSSGEVDDAGG